MIVGVCNSYAQIWRLAALKDIVVIGIEFDFHPSYPSLSGEYMIKTLNLITTCLLRFWCKYGNNTLNWLVILVYGVKTICTDSLDHFMRHTKAIVASFLVEKYVTVTTCQLMTLTIFIQVKVILRQICIWHLTANIKQTCRSHDIYAQRLNNVLI